MNPEAWELPASDPGWERMRDAGQLAGRPVVYLPAVDSTNTYALSPVLRGAAAGTLIVAETQTAGRGRLGRQWLSPPGCGLYLSLLLRPALSGEALPRVTLAAGVAVCLAVEQATGLQPKLKWPNDILLDGKKAGGILTETAGMAPGAAEPRPLVVVGIGVNVNTPAALFPGPLAAHATSLLAAAGRPFARSLILTALAAEVERAVAALEQGRWPEILRQWRARDGTRGRALSWVTPGRKTVRGESLGIDDQGLLHIRDAEGRIHAVLSGDLQLVSGGAHAHSRA